MPHTTYEIELDDIEVENEEGTDTIAVTAALTIMTRGSEIINIAVEYVIDEAAPVETVLKEINKSNALKARVEEKIFG